MRTIGTALLGALLLSAGCATPYITPAISDLDDNDLKVQVRSNDRKVTVQDMLPIASVEAEKGCSRWQRDPEYISHIIHQDWWTFGEALAEGLRPAAAQRPAPTEMIVEFIFACVDREAKIGS